MNILIVEDEKLAFERLSLLLRKANLEINNIAHYSSVSEAVQKIKTESFDLAFFDIELSDGLSFRILEQAHINFPIIFTTAYNQYAIQAFKHNSIDYLLKPIDRNELNNAIEKFNTHWKKSTPKIDEKKLITDFKNLLQDNYKKRFTVKIGEHIRILETKDIRLVYSQNKGTYIRTTRNALVDYSLDRIDDLLSPKIFFRISRKHIVSIDFIKDIVVYSNSRLKIILHTDFEEELIVSREKVQYFKKWLEGE